MQTDFNFRFVEPFTLSLPWWGSAPDPTTQSTVVEEPIVCAILLIEYRIKSGENWHPSWLQMKVGGNCQKGTMYIWNVCVEERGSPDCKICLHLFGGPWGLYGENLRNLKQKVKRCQLVSLMSASWPRWLQSHCRARFLETFQRGDCCLYEDRGHFCFCSSCATPYIKHLAQYSARKRC